MQAIKSILKSTVMFCVLVLISIGCKKDSSERISSLSTQSKTVQQQTTYPTIAGRFHESITVSDYGFLVFPTVEDLEEYHEFLITNTHVVVQHYLDSLNFHSLGANIYGEAYLDQTVTEEQAIDYVLSLDQVFQIEHVIMKTIGQKNCETLKWDFLLTITKDNLSSTSYENLVAGTFDPSTMNKFATNPSEHKDPLFDFISDNPSGFEEIKINACPEDNNKENRFLGWGWHKDYNFVVSEGPYCSKTYSHQHYDIFWIPVKCCRDKLISSFGCDE